jgi:hypothetical protein
LIDEHPRAPMALRPGFLLGRSALKTQGLT